MVNEKETGAEMPKVSPVEIDAADNVLDMALETDGAPTSFDIEIDSDILASDPVINKRLEEAGFTKEQAELVYALAEEIILPILCEISESYRTARELDRLEAHFGGQERFDEVARQISTWAKKSIPEDVYAALNSTYHGVLALYSMMGSTEPETIAGAGQKPAAVSDKKLREMMKDPRYWRDHDEDFIRQVNTGFKELYAQEDEE